MNALPAAIALLIQVPPPFQTVDLDRGESAEVSLPGGPKVRVRLIDLQEHRCDLRGAVRRAEATVEIEGERATLPSALYNLPRPVGPVQVDCPVTRGYTANSSKDNVWALEKDARLRLWPADAPWIDPRTFLCPAGQRWFASDTQMGNDPCYVDGGEVPGQKKIYYHYGLDFGGAEGCVPVRAASDGVVVSRGTETLPGDRPPLVKPRYDVVYLLDDRGWYHRYSHLAAIDPSVHVGRRLALGDPIGVLGKEGASGGWSHLHFDVCLPQPSGKYGMTDAYALAFESYRRRHGLTLLAVARPHRVAWAGEPVTLEGTRSWHAGGPARLRRWEWRFTDGGTAEGPVVTRTYGRPGHYTEILTVTDDEGRSAVDFAVVQVFDRERPKPPIPTLHVAFWPTTGVRAGEEVTFKARAFNVRPDEGREAWDFGDGSEPVFTRSDGNAQALAKDGYAVTTHRYARPGRYIVTVTRANDLGWTATGRVWLEVGPAAGGGG